MILLKNTNIDTVFNSSSNKTKSDNKNIIAPSSAVKIKDFGAHSIDEKRYSTFDSSTAINNAIRYAIKNSIKSVDFGSGRYYAKNIQLLGNNMTYFSTHGAELIAPPSITTWSGVLTANKQSNFTIKGLTINGNKSVVPGNSHSGIFLISLTACNNITVQNCYLHNNRSVGLMLQNNCNNVTIKKNKIYDTDCGVLSQHVASNNILIDGNTIYGSSENQISEPISIYNTNSAIAHDIKITNNIIHDKKSASGIFVMNATKVLISKNTVYNCSSGINIGIESYIASNNITKSTNLDISSNNIYNCGFGIYGEISNSKVYNNTIRTINHIGIWLLSRSSTSTIDSDTVSNNSITNVNGIGDLEPAVRLENSTNSTIDSNIVSDTRTTTLNSFILQIRGTNSNNNIIQNNTNLGSITKNGHKITILQAKNTTVKKPSPKNFLIKGITSSIAPLPIL